MRKRAAGLLQVGEWATLAGHLLVILMALACDQDHVGRCRGRQGAVDRDRPIRLLLRVRMVGQCRHDLRDDGQRVFAAWVVAGDEDTVGLAC